jgi:hypothetical protein
MAGLESLDTSLTQDLDFCGLTVKKIRIIF